MNPSPRTRTRGGDVVERARGRRARGLARARSRSTRASRNARRRLALRRAHRESPAHGAARDARASARPTMRRTIERAVRRARRGCDSARVASRGVAVRAMTTSVTSARIGRDGSLGRRTATASASDASGWNFLRRCRTMFVQTQATPNPESLMFQPGRDVYAEGSRNFGSAREAMVSPLARRLFAIDGVTNVFLGVDFITVTKDADHDWETVKPRTFEAIMDFYASGEAVVDEASLEGHGTAIEEDDDEVVAMIKELLETRIRPAVAEDGGDIVFKAYDQETGVVSVQLMGACDGCPSSSVTLKSGIENMLMHYVPEVKGVQQWSPEDELDILELANLHRGRR